MSRACNYAVTIIKQWPLKARLQSLFQNFNEEVNQISRNVEGQTDEHPDRQTDRLTSSIHRLELLCNLAEECDVWKIRTCTYLILYIFMRPYQMIGDILYLSHLSVINFKLCCNVWTVRVVLNLGSKKCTHFLGQKGHFLSQNLILRAHDFAAPRHYAAN